MYGFMFVVFFITCLTLKHITVSQKETHTKGLFVKKIISTEKELPNVKPLVLINSLGGVASSKFLTNIKKVIDTNDCCDGDGLKHRDAHWFHRKNATIYGQSRGKDVHFSKVLVIIGDPIHSIQSVYRRFRFGHINKWRRNINKPRFKYNIHLSDIWTQTILKNNDILGISEYLSSWSTFCNHNSDICKMVSTKTLYENSLEICNFLSSHSKECDQLSHLKYMPESITKRNSRLATVPKKVIDIYTQLYNKYEDSS